MKTLVIIIIALVVAIIIAGIVLSAIQIKNLNQKLSKTIDNHLVEITIKYTTCSLSIDSKVVDQITSIKSTTCKLTAKLENQDIIVNIGSGFLKPRIITFINGAKDNDLSNC